MKGVMALMVFVFVAVFAGVAHAECEVSVDGEVKATGKSKGGGAREFNSDYWYTPDELDKAVESMANVFGGDVKDKDKKIAEAKKKDPKIMTFIFNCIPEGEALKFMFVPNGKYKDVPFGPKKYTLANLLAKPGQVAVLIEVKNEDYALESGTLDVTAFDEKRFAGTFELKAKSKTGQITAKGKFDHPCDLPTKFCKKAK